MDRKQAEAVLARYDSARYHRYEEMTEMLQACAARWPDLCRLESTGTSPEGRSIWSVTLTNIKTGPDTSKPAYHINGQHHAGEVTAGAERYFDHPQMLRSSPLLYPEPDEQEGLVPEDIDGDGRILMMRIPHPQGDWKVSEKDPRIMVRRRPEDRTGAFYRVLVEGMVRGEYRGREIKQLSTSAYDRERGFDFNRNYPTNWQPQHRMRGSGRYPFDRPEIRAMANFWLSHKNIGGAMSYHTYSGLNLRPSPLVPDSTLIQHDLALYKAVGRLSEEMTGYRTVSVYEEFTVDYTPDRMDVGSWLEWAYDELGVMGFEMELWDWPYIAVVPKRPFKELRSLTDEQREEEEILKLQWIDRELPPGEGFIPWRPFDHPQLGPVEIGGYDPKYLIQNPPPKLLPQECHKNCLFTVEHALSLPLLRIGQAEAAPVGAGLYKLSVQVRNEGYLPTNVTQAAVNMRQTEPVTAVLALPEGARLVAGQPKVELGHLEGRGSPVAGAWGGRAPETERWVDWVVQAPAGAVLTVRVEHDRGGTVERAVAL